MIRFTKRSLAWTFSTVFFVSVVVHMWYSVQWIFTSSHDKTSPASMPSSTLVPSPTPSITPITTAISNVTTPNIIPPSSKPSRYERDYTTLTAYPVSLFIVYCFYVITTRYRRIFPDAALPVANTTTFSSLSSHNSIDCDQQQRRSSQQDQQQAPPLSINNNSSNRRKHSYMYLIWRRWWHYEFRCFDNTFQLGTYFTLLALCGLHAVFILWPFILRISSLDSLSPHTTTDPYLQHQLLSNRIAQLALVDMAIVVALSVRTSVLWRMIGLYNGSMTLPWHRWFARFSIFGVAYHGCFQWTKHYYKHHLAINPPPLSAAHSMLDPFHDDSDNTHSHDLMSSSSLTWWDLLVSNPHYLTGTCMVICLLALFLGSHPLVREKWYRLFRATHVVAFLALVVIGMWHHWSFMVFYIAVVCVWMVDMIARLRSNRVAPIVALEVVADQILKLQVILDPLPTTSCRCRRVSSRRPKQPLALLPGQYVFCSFSGSKWKDILHSHPFSISHVDTLEKSSAESSESQMLTFYIKVYGKQTKALYDSANIKEKWPTVRIGTPLGHPAESCHWTNIYGLYPVVVLVAEGIGITPWMAVLHSLVMMMTDPNINNTKHVHLIWTVRNGNMIKPFLSDIEEMMATVLATTTKVDEGDGNGNHDAFQLDWHIFVTGTRGINGLDEEQQHGITSSSPVSSSSSDCLQKQQQQQQHCHYQYHQGRPNYANVLEFIRSKHENKDVALGICAHEESVKICGNLARSSRFSHANAFWNVRSERFEL